MSILLASTLLLAQVPGEADVQRLDPQVLASAAQVGVHLPATIPANWQALPVPAAQPPLAGTMAPWPTVDWSVSTPAAQGMDQQLIDVGFNYAQNRSSNALLVIRNGYIVSEWYAGGWAQDDREDGFSMAKSVSSAMYGVALQERIFQSPFEPVSDYVTEWDDPAHRDVEIRHLLSMTSGLHWDVFTDYVLLGLAFDQSQFAVNLGMDADPGTTWVYNNAACQVLAETFLRRTGRQLHEYWQARVADVIGMHDATWMTDFVGNTLTYRSVNASAREFAKFGYLFLREGEWDGQRVMPQRWVDVSTRPSQDLNPFYGLLWWLNTGRLEMPSVPADAYYAAGLGEKRIYVVPSKDLVVIRLGPGDLFWDDDAFLGPICDAVY